MSTTTTTSYGTTYGTSTATTVQVQQDTNYEWNSSNTTKELMQWMITSTTTSSSTTTTTTASKNNNSTTSNNSNEISIQVPSCPISNTILQYEESIRIPKNYYNVIQWIQYLDIIDDWIQDTTNNPYSSTPTSDTNDNHNDNDTTDNQQQQQQQQKIVLYNRMIQVRHFIGQRSIQLLPKSYKLWKYHWEFVLQYHNTNSSNVTSKSNTSTSTIASTIASTTTTNCFQITDIIILSMFQQGFVTLYMYPKFWIVYIQWYIQNYLSCTNSTHQHEQDQHEQNQQEQEQQPQFQLISKVTYFRRLIDLSLSSLSVPHHSKIWSIVSNFLLVESQQQQQLEKEHLQKHIIPIETTYRIMKRYINFLLQSIVSYNSIVTVRSSYSTIIQFTQWCTSIHVKKYNTAAQYYIQLLNLLRTSTSTSNSNTNLLILSNELKFQCWTLLLDLITQHPEMDSYNHSTTTTTTTKVENSTTTNSNTSNGFIETIPWEKIIRTEIQRQISQQNYKKSNNSNKKKNNNKDNIDIDTVMDQVYEMSSSNSTTTTDTLSTTNNNNNSNRILLVGMLYSNLATAWIVRGEFDLARTVYEEGIVSVWTVRDFTILYSSYLQLEDSIVTNLTDTLLNNDSNDNESEEENDTENGNGDDDDDVDMKENSNEDNNDEDDWDILAIGYPLILDDDSDNTDDDDDDDDDTKEKDKKKNNKKKKQQQKKKIHNKNEQIMKDIEFAIARAEHLTYRRPLLLNAVQIRQNPTNGTLWIERSKLYMDSTNNNSNNNSSTSTSVFTSIDDDDGEVEDKENLTTLNNNSTNYHYEQAAAALEEGLRTVCTSISNSKQGNPISSIVQQLVLIYEIHLKDLDRAHDVLDRVCCGNENSSNDDEDDDNDNEGEEEQQGQRSRSKSKRRLLVRRNYQYPVASLEDATYCWTMYIEFCLRNNEQYNDGTDALALARQSIHQTMKLQKLLYDGTTSTAASAGNNDAPNDASIIKKQQNQQHVTINLYKSTILWDLLFDLEECYGTVQTTKDCYNNAIESKVITIQQLLNYATYCIEQQYYEESFHIYERGIELFPSFPECAIIWKQYIQNFIQRYKGTKIERTRNIFQRCIEVCPSNDTCIIFYLLYGQYEERYGLTYKRTLNVYRDLCHTVVTKGGNIIGSKEKYMCYQLWITKTIQFIGLSATRDIYQEAIKVFQNDSTRSADIFCTICIEFANVEIQFQQIDRARSIYEYGSQQANPLLIPHYWNKWNTFEIQYGTEDTFREMLRTKRTIEAAYSTTSTRISNTINTNSNDLSTKSTNNVNSTMMDMKPLSDNEAIRMIAAREGVDLDEEGVILLSSSNTESKIPGFLASSSKRPPTTTTIDDVEERVAKIRKVVGQATNSISNTNVDTNEIDLDDDDDNDNDDNEINLDENDNDNNEINLDDIDAEIEQAVAEGEENMDKDSTSTTSKQQHTVSNITTKAVPKAVFGGLV